jgi:hypothetical protein
LNLLDRHFIRNGDINAPIAAPIVIMPIKNPCIDALLAIVP